MFRTPGVSVTYPRYPVQVHQCLFNPVQSISSFQPAPTGVLKLAGLPHAFFDLAYLFLELEEEAGGFAVARNLSSERQITNMLKGRLELVEVVNAELETPKVVLSVPWTFSLIVVRHRIQWPPILQVISRDDANNMGIQPHDDSGVAHRNAPPPIVSDDARHIVSPAIEIKT